MVENDELNMDIVAFVDIATPIYRKAAIEIVAGLKSWNYIQKTK